MINKPKRSIIFSGLVYHKAIRFFILIISMVALFLGLGVLNWNTSFQISHSSEIATVTMVDVGQGDGFIIDHPTGQRFFIDIGQYYEKLSNTKNPSSICNSLLNSNCKNKLTALIRKFEIFYNKVFTRKTGDFIYLTHDDADHAGSIDRLSRDLEVGAYALSPLKYTYVDKLNINHRSVNEDSSRQNITPGRTLNLMISGVNIQASESGTYYDVSDGKIFHNVGKFTVLYPTLEILSIENIKKDTRAANNMSLIIKYEYGSTSILFTGDAGHDEENYIMKKYNPEYLKADILKVGHHGSKNSSSLEFINAVSPYMALISAEKDNKYGHPHRIVLQNLLKAQIDKVNILRTDTCGTIKLVLYKNGAIGRQICNQ